MTRTHHVTENRYMTEQLSLEIVLPQRRTLHSVVPVRGMCDLDTNPGLWRDRNHWRQSQGQTKRYHFEPN